MDKSYQNDVITIKDEIQSLIYPNETHMDFNISTALKLASQLNGKLLSKEKFLCHMDNYFEVITKKLTENVLVNKIFKKECQHKQLL